MSETKERSWKANRGQKIERLYAFIATEPDGGEGVVGVNMTIAGREMFVPLVGADLERIESYRSYAEAVQQASGIPNKIVEFSIRREMTDG